MRSPVKLYELNNKEVKVRGKEFWRHKIHPEKARRDLLGLVIQKKKN